MFFPSTNWFVFIIVSYVSTSSTKQNGNPIKVSYEGAQVWRSYLRNGKAVDVFNALFDEQAISLWAMKTAYVDYLVRPSQMVAVGQHLHSGHGISHQVLIRGLEQRLTKHRNLPKSKKRDKIRTGHQLNFTDFLPLGVIYEYLDYINLNDLKTTVTTIGQSLENRPIKMAAVSNSNAGNKAILIMAGAHAREWAGVSSVLYILNELINKYDSLPDHVTNKNWYIIPVWNPDGYHYTHTVDRLWRKNRRIFDDDENCEGVDLNRNFGHNWYNGDFVTYQSPCQESYRGKFPFSEPETVAVKNQIDGGRFTALVDVHSYGQEVVYPWASMSEPTPHDATLQSIAEDMAMEANKFGSYYKNGPLYHIQYPATGSIIDYAYASGINYPFIIETRDTGQNGFVLPPAQIVSASMEVQAAIYSLAKSLETL